jgi:hypothetical protein
LGIAETLNIKFGKSLLTPSYTRKPDFRSHESTEKQFTFVCTQCAQPVIIEYATLINRGLAWEEDVDETFAAEAKSFYGIGVVGKSRDGGWPSMMKVECSDCKTLFLVYAGVNEVGNSVYIVTMQGITELTETV